VTLSIFENIARSVAPPIFCQSIFLMLKESSPKNWGTSTNFKVLPKETVAEKSPNLVALLARAREGGGASRMPKREKRK
jgi:hypothetical protein